MASTSHLRPFSALAFIVISLGALSADPGPSFSFHKFAKDAYLESNLAMYGDAKVVSGGSSVQLTDAGSPSAGSVVYRRPIRIVQGNPEKLVSFSTYFSFSLSGGDGNDLAFALCPSGFNVDEFGDNGSPFGLLLEKNRPLNRTVAVRFDSAKNSVAIDVGGLGPVKVKNVSSLNLVLNGGSKFHSWIDYEAGSRRLEVRVSRSSESRPSDPVLARFVDLRTMWKEGDVFLGLSSSNGNSSRACFIHSWSFKLRHVPQWMHSEPLDPQAVGRNTKNLGVHEKNDCFLKVLAAMIFGTGSGALGAFVVLYLWTIFGNRRPVAPEEFVVEPVDLKKCSKLEVIVDKAVKDVNATK
ncbi:probable L-type lectin-domain containing receptor kinase S.7 [Rhodamnia argentea]|uniref:Probable L-type lectin-domain containing receptor kinase S.7 n=1 Tax=Rhodamnia argentea TaxID=178133 RepID=A0A8B8NG51_9MYRT|nr:probable L-type lectin-domain containing receptor kinase S.7 [Rhodamnia argentea]